MIWKISGWRSLRPIRRTSFDGCFWRGATWTMSWWYPSTKTLTMTTGKPKVVPAIRTKHHTRKITRMSTRDYENITQKKGEKVLRSWCVINQVSGSIKLYMHDILCERVFLYGSNIPDLFYWDKFKISMTRSRCRQKLKWKIHFCCEPPLVPPRPRLFPNEVASKALIFHASSHSKDIFGGHSLLTSRL